MALFKIFKGNEIRALSDPTYSGYRQPVDGYAYYNTDNQQLYIDADYDGNNIITRKPINAHLAYSAGYDGANSPQKIHETYIKGISISNNQLSYITGDGVSHSVDGTIGAVTGVKGNTEITYRTGQINLTPENIGAATNGHTHTTTITTGNEINQLTLAFGTKYKLTAGGTSYTFTMPANPNTNTASAADNILHGSNNGTEITYAPYTTRQSNLSFDTTTTNPSGTDRLNLNGYLYATKLYSGGKEVITEYTFTSGTNGFTVTPSGGIAQTVTVTPSITNNITGSGANGYLTKFNGTNTITNGPALGSSTTTFLRNDGTWATPPVTSVAGKTGAVGLESLTIGNSIYNGSTPIEVSIADLGLSSSITFLGVTTNNIQKPNNGVYDTTNPVTLISGNNVAAVDGNVVLVKSSGEEFLWTEGHWESLGLATSYALQNHLHGNITSQGAIVTEGKELEEGDQLLFTNANNSRKIEKTAISFDGLTTTSFLSKKGTWQAVPDASTSQKGIVQLVDSVSSTNSTATDMAATVRVVKEVNDNKVNKSGDTMTGTLALTNGNLDDSTSTSGWVSGNSKISLTDTNEIVNGQLEVAKEGNVAHFKITASTYNTEQSEYLTNALDLGINKDGTKTVGVSDQAAWRTALGLGNLSTLSYPLPLHTGAFLRGDGTWSNTLNNYYISLNSGTNGAGFAAQCFNGNNELQSDIRLFANPDGGSGIWLNDHGTAHNKYAVVADANNNVNFYGRLSNPGLNSLWVNGRDYAIVKMSTVDGYSPAFSLKTNNGSWDIGTYNNDANFTDDLIFSYISDTDYQTFTSSQDLNSNRQSSYIKFLENGHIVGTLDGNAATATKLSSTPNNATTFLRGDNTWSSSLTGFFGAQGIELSFSTPYIDFHYNNSTTDYTSRLIEKSSGTLTCENNFQVNGQIHSGGGIWTHNYTNDTNDRVIVCENKAGGIYLVSNSDAVTGARGIWTYNSSGNYTAICMTAQNNSTTFYGNLSGNANTATQLSNTPNNTGLFLRGDNTWNNVLMNDIYSGETTDTQNTRRIGVRSSTGSLWLSSNPTWPRRFLWAVDKNNNGKEIIGIDENNNATFHGDIADTRIHRFQDTGIIYSDLLNTTYSGLVLSGGQNYGFGATMLLRNADTNNDNPGGFAIGTATTSAQSSINHWLLGKNNGLLTWDGGLSVTTGANPGCGTVTGHTISTNGNIGCYAEMFARGGFYAGSTSPALNCWTGSAWSNIVGTWPDNNGNSYINAAGNRLHVGWDHTNDIIFGGINGYKFGIWQYGATMISRIAGFGTDNGGPALAIREVNEVGNQSDKADINYSPRIAFHWSGRECVHIGLESDGIFRFRTHTSGNLHTIQAGAVWGAVWNDYAEMRNVPEVQKLMKEKKPVENYEVLKRDIPMAGYVVHEVGDDTMELVNERLLRGCRVISDTFGFNIGETENAKTPIAVSGRVLVYCHEGREAAASHIGYGVCSGPNGTVSIMTEEEERMYPMSIIGTISAVPDYEEWGEEHIKVNGRIWIYVK